LKTSFKIIVITPENFEKHEISNVCKLFSSNLKLLHLRKPHASKEELRNYLLQIPKIFYKNIVLHNHYELIKEFKLKGAHLTKKSRGSVKLTNLLKRKKIKIISTSFHNTSEIKRSRRKYEYFFLSPIFDSISKNHYKSGFNLGELNLFLKTNKTNIVALGGINEKNIKTVKKVGFSGAGTIGYVWKSKNPIKSYRNLLSKIK